MMKVGIIGATGKSGSLITQKAVAAGFEVTAIVRNAQKLTLKTDKVLEKDAFVLKAEDLQGFDAIVLAYKAPVGKETLYSELFSHLIEIMQNNPARLIIVSGAGSLYTDDSKIQKMVDTFPKNVSWANEPVEMNKAGKLVENSAINYTLFSPAVEFNYDGAETNNYTITDDILRKNAAGESQISYADYANAVIQIIKESSHQRERIGIYQN